MSMRTAFLIAAALTALAACGPSTTHVRRPPAPTETAAGAVYVDWPSLGQWTRTSEAPDDVAVIVAVEDYAFLPDVQGATTNASEWEAYFMSRGMKDIFVVTNGDAAAEEMLRYADVAVKTAKPTSRVWYVFVGHGAPASDGSDGVLIGMDARQTPDSISARGVRQKDLLQRLEVGQQAQTILVVDACFSGRSADGQALARGTQPVLPVNSTLNLSPKTVVLSAAKADQFAGALPGADRPAFSYLLLGALRGWADDGDGRLTAGAAMDYVAQQMRHVSGRTQTPELSGARGAVLTANAREADPGVAERMRLAASGAPVVGDDNAVRVDTGAGVVVTQIDGWTPTSPNGALVAFSSGRPNAAYFHLLGWRDPEGKGMDWVNELHNEYQKLEEQIRPTQVVTLGNVKTFETAYLAKVQGAPVTIYVWDVVRPGAFYRAVGLSFNSDRFGAEDYKDFQTFVRLLRFGSATNAPRLSDGKPGILGRMSKADPSDPEQAEHPELPDGWERDRALEDEHTKLSFTHEDGSRIIWFEQTLESSQAAQIAAQGALDEAGKNRSVVRAPAKVKLGENLGVYARYTRQDTPNHLGTVSMWTRTNNNTVWFVMLSSKAANHDKHISAYSDMISNTRFFR